MSKSFWDNSGHPIAIAHRGGDAAGSDKENTLLALEAAKKLGYEYGETDVILSKDGQVVAIHGAANLLDGLLRRRHSRRGMQRRTLKQLRSKYAIGGEQIPTLEQLLTSQPKMKFFIDPKTEEVLEPLYLLLKKLDVFDRVCVGSFNYQRIQNFKRLAAKQPVHTSFIIGRSLRVRNKSKNMLEEGQVAGVDAVQLHHSLVSNRMVKLTHEQDLRVLVWTANSPLAINNAIKCGADGIISDRVKLLRDLLHPN